MSTGIQMTVAIIVQLWAPERQLFAPGIQLSAPERQLLDRIIIDPGPGIISEPGKAIIGPDNAIIVSGKATILPITQ